MAKGLLRQALSSLESARKASQDQHWAFAVRSCQDVSELSLKALLLSTDHEPPKTHNLAEALKGHRGDLSQVGLRSDQVDEMARAASELAEDRGRSLYGDEKRQIPPTALYDRADAKRALDAAEGIHRCCREVVGRNLGRA
jgi:HEPN domain-containing protein